MADYDTVVVGLGAIGTSTTLELAKRGEDVLGLEQYGIPNQRGASHGVSRIFRLAYHEGESYVPLLKTALTKWERLSVENGNDLFFRTGSLMIGEEGSEDFESAKSTCENRDITHTVLSGDEVSERYEGFDLPSHYRAIYQPDGGLLDSERCVVAQVEKAVRKGAEVHGHEKVVDWETDGETVVVETNRSEYTSDSLVIASGAWAKNQVENLSDVLEIVRHVVGRFKMKPDERFRVGRFPVWVADIDEREFYGLPIHRYPGVKVGDLSQGSKLDNMSEMNRDVSIDEEGIAKGFAERFFSGEVHSTMDISPCPLTTTPDRNYIVDRSSDHPNVFYGVGMSGHGFKLSNVVGEILSDMVIEGDTEYDIGHLRLGRFD